MRIFILKQTNTFGETDIVGMYFSISDVDKKLNEIYNKDCKYVLELEKNGVVIEKVKMEIGNDEEVV